MVLSSIGRQNTKKKRTKVTQLLIKSYSITRKPGVSAFLSLRLFSIHLFHILFFSTLIFRSPSHLLTASLSLPLLFFSIATQWKLRSCHSRSGPLRFAQTYFNPPERFSSARNKEDRKTQRPNCFRMLYWPHLLSRRFNDVKWERAILSGGSYTVSYETNDQLWSSSPRLIR